MGLFSFLKPKRPAQPRKERTEDVRNRNLTCLGCRAKIEVITDIATVPQASKYIICAHCGYVQVLEPGRPLREPSSAELGLLLRSKYGPSIVAFQSQARRPGRRLPR